VKNMRRPLIASLVAGAVCLAAGCQSRTPGPIETNVMTWVKRRVLVGNKKAVNPLQATPDAIHAGQIAFSHYCFTCHGLDGQNIGVPFAETVAPPVPSLNSPQVQKYTDGQLKSVISNGIFPSGMPASKEILSEEEIWSIVIYLRHLPPKGSLGEPAAYSDEEVTRLKSAN
jgi:mono/diheme cytochrome c family protein